MKRYHLNHSVIKFSLGLLLILFAARLAAAQGSAFTYQGRLTDGDSPANGLYDMRFELFPDSINGPPLSEPIINPTVEVTNGVFTVQLGFAEELFTGQPRYIEIGIRPAGSTSPYTILSPRQQILSVPYAVQSLRTVTAANSDQLGGVAASGFIQNGSSQQASTNFNISGSGTLGGVLNANTVNTTTQYNIGGNRALSVAGTNNLFVGLGTGAANTTGNSNTFVGAFAGNDNTTANNNSFFGAGAGRENRVGANNSFFGSFAGTFNSASANSFFGSTSGYNNTVGSDNSFFGASAGTSNTTGNGNAFFGRSAGEANITGGANSSFGYLAGAANTTSSRNSFFGRGAGENATGSGNTFVGAYAGLSNTTESDNTLIGSDAEVAAGITNATAIGALAQVTQSNSLVLGSIGGVNGAAATVNVGIGTTAPTARLHVVGSAFISSSLATSSVATGSLTVSFLGAAGSTQLCRNASNQIATCSSSLRYKDRLAPFTAGLELINRLRPITFNWKASGERDLGLGAEDVAAIEPLLVTYNGKGQVEGVKYDRISVVLINAIKQLQAEKSAEIKSLGEENAALRKQNADLDARLKAVEQRIQTCMQPNSSPQVRGLKPTDRD